MKIFFKILCVIFALSALGSIVGEVAHGSGIFPLGFILAAVFGYLGWRDTDSKKHTDTAGTDQP